MLELFGKYKEKTLTIDELPVDNFRKIMKLKIYLNSNKNASYSLNGKLLSVSFTIDDERTITKEISKIVGFIESTLECKVNLEEAIAAKIEENKEKQAAFKEAINTLKTFKSEAIEDNSTFAEYCTFCDKTLSCELRPYQYSASFYMAMGHGGFDFSVPGSGKTIISYATYNCLKHKEICDSVLIIGPINSFNAWYDEYFTCFGREPDFISLANMSKDDALVYLMSSKANHKEITFINIDKAWRLTKEIISFLSNKKCLLVIDEAHKEKNPDAEITKCVLEITKFVENRIILTGTPMPNGYEDLFSLMAIYSPYEKILPYNFSELKRLTKNGATEAQQEKIMDAIHPLYSRVSKKHLLETGELKEPIFTVVTCDLSPEQREIYDFLNKVACDIDDDFESALNVSLMKAVLIRKMQVSANPGLLSKSIINSIDEYRNEYANEFGTDGSDNELLMKADNDLRKMVSDSQIASLVYRFDSNFLETPKNRTAVNLALKIVSSGKKVIIWDVFVQNMNTLKYMLERKYPGRIEIINGMVGGQDRQDSINRFKYGDSMILIANPATLAESISLHRCCQNAIYVNRNYNAAQFIQSKDRIHRINMPIGSTANYYFLINRNTVDEEVDARLKLKETRMLKILDSKEIVVGGFEFENNNFMSLDDVLSSYKK